MLGACTFFLGTQTSRVLGNLRPSRSSTSSSTSGACAIHLAASVALRDCWFIENGSCARNGTADQLLTRAMHSESQAPPCATAGSSRMAAARARGPQVRFSHKQCNKCVALAHCFLYAMHPNQGLLDAGV